MARENGVYSNSVEPCWCQRGIEDRLSPNTDGDGSEAEQSSSTTFPRRRRRSSSTTMRRSSPSSSSFFAKFSPFDTTASSSSSGRGSSSRRSRSSTSPSRTSFFAWLVVLLLLVDSVAGCGPGRRAGRRRRPRKLTPLVFKQHVPNVSENTLAASGLTEGRVTRGSKRFEELVPNYNPDIIFKDEEGTGADRFMTPRCKEKLNTLAISVMNQWPDVKLRVTEGWDEEGYHAPNSLHYEGRAVDIATSDRDRSKYGMLARLAVEAGFDWVYYESRSHIHCSVKSESSQGKSGGCFPGTSHVTTPTGHKRLADLSIGDSVLTMTREGSLVYRPVLMFLDVNREAGRTFIELTTTSGRKMFLTPSHLVYVVSNDGDEIERNGLFDGRVPFEKHADDALDTNEIDVNPKFAKTTTSSSSAPRSAQAIFARDVKPGMSVLVAATASSSHVESEVVISAQPVLKTDGFFAPLTSEGTVVVDDVVASCYAVLEDQYLAHWAFWPVRSYYRVKNWLFPTTVNSAEAKSSSTVVDHRGIHWYAKALYSLAQYVLPEKMLYDRS